MIDDLLATKTRIDAFISDPLNNPLTNSEQLILAGYYSYILNVRASLEALPAQEITDHHLQMFINSHENGFAMIVPCKIELLIAKECLERRRLERETALTKQPNNVDDLLCAVEEVLRISDRKHDAWNRAYAAIASIRNGVTAPAQPVIPGQLTLRMAEEKALSLGAVLYDEEAEVFADGWNACRDEMLKAQPVSEPSWVSVKDGLPELQLGGIAQYWVYFKANHDGSMRVSQATYINAPFTGEEEEEPVWAMYSECGDPFNAVGWYDRYDHPDYAVYYKPIEFGEVIAYLPIVEPAAPAQESE